MAKLPKSFWGEALNTVVHVINLSPTVILDGDATQNFGYIRKLLMIIHESLVARPIFMLQRMKGLS